MLHAAGEVAGADDNQLVAVAVMVGARVFVPEGLAAVVFEEFFGGAFGEVVGILGDVMREPDAAVFLFEAGDVEFVFGFAVVEVEAEEAVGVLLDLGGGEEADGARRRAAEAGAGHELPMGAQTGGVAVAFAEFGVHEPSGGPVFFPVGGTDPGGSEEDFSDGIGIDLGSPVDNGDVFHVGHDGPDDPFGIISADVGAEDEGAAGDGDGAALIGRADAGDDDGGEALGGEASGGGRGGDFGGEDFAGGVALVSRSY